MEQELIGKPVSIVFPTVPSRETSDSGKQNYLFPLRPDIKCVMFFYTFSWLPLLGWCCRLRHFCPVTMHLYRPTHISAMSPDYPKEVKKCNPPLQGPQITYFLQYIHLLVSPTIYPLVKKTRGLGVLLVVSREPRPRPITTVGGCVFVSNVGGQRGEILSLWLEFKVREQRNKSRNFFCGWPSQINAVTYNHNSTSRACWECLTSHTCHGWAGPRISNAMANNFSVPCPEIIGNHLQQFFGFVKIHGNPPPNLSKSYIFFSWHRKT